MHCKKLNKFENETKIEYDEILKSNVRNQIQIARKFIENLKIRNQLIEV